MCLMFVEVKRYLDMAEKFDMIFERLMTNRHFTVNIEYNNKG